MQPTCNIHFTPTEGILAVALEPASVRTVMLYETGQERFWSQAADRTRRKYVIVF
jgi:hypothetical protein